MLSPTIPPFRKRRGRTRQPSATPTPPPPPPPPPPEEAHVVSAHAWGETACELVFDRPVPIVGSPDDAIVVAGGVAPSSAEQAGENTIRLNTWTTIEPGASWQISRSPAWIGVPVATGSGMFS